MDELLGAALAASAAVIIIALIIGIIMIVAYWKVFEKAGRPGWAAIVPIYNMIVLLQTAKLSPWLIFVFFAGIIPFIGYFIVLAFQVFICYKVAKAFGHDIGYTLGLFFLPFIFYPMLAFGDSQYVVEEK